MKSTIVKRRGLTGSGRHGALSVGAIAGWAAISIAALSPSWALAQASPHAVAEKILANLRSAVLQNDTEQITAFAKVGMDLSLLGDEGQRMMFIAAEHADGAMIDALIALGGDINQRDGKGYTPVMSALAVGNLENALIIRNYGADLDVVASDGYNAEALAQIIGAEGFEPETTYASSVVQKEAEQLLLLAIELGDVEGVKFALTSGASAAAQAPNGWTALMLAAMAGHENIVKLLVSELKRTEPDALAEQRHKTVGDDKFDVVMAAFVGEGGAQRDQQKAARIVQILRIELFDGSFEEERISHYRGVAKRVGYAPLISEPALSAGVKPGQSFVFYESPEFLPALEYNLPHGVPSDGDGWMAVQKVLAAEGLYHGPIDGHPGEMTYAALLSYIEPLEQILVTRAREAIAMGKETAQGGPIPTTFGYDVVGDYAGEFRTVSVDGNKRRQPAGYTGYSRNKGAEGHRYRFEFAFGSDGRGGECSVTNDGPETRSRVFSCPLLGGTVSLVNTREYDSVSLVMNATPVLTFTNRSSPTQIPVPGGE